MIQLVLFVAFTLVGALVGNLTHVNPIDEPLFPIFASFALVVGLYGSVVGIDLRAVAAHKWTAVIVITVAVPIQILASGAVMYLIYPFGVSFLLAVAMTQIDPLSVDTLLQDKDSMSPEAKGLLRIWASFDDPVTVLFGFLLLLPAVAGVTASSAVPNPVIYVALNLFPALAVWLLKRYTDLFEGRWLSLFTLLALLTLAFFTQSYLLAAILGLLLRPIPDRYFSRLISVLYYTIVFIVGMAMNSYADLLGTGIRLGALLAMVEFFIIQPFTTILVFNGTPNDILRIAFAQQNGLTTLLMGIAFQTLGVPVLHILLPAIVIINLFNLVVNKIYSWKEARGLIHIDGA